MAESKSGGKDGITYPSSATFGSVNDHGPAIKEVGRGEGVKPSK